VPVRAPPFRKPEEALAPKVGLRRRRRSAAQTSRLRLSSERERPRDLR
jgi:hypothetical protein